MAANNSSAFNLTISGNSNYVVYLVGLRGVLMIPIIFGNLLILISWIKFKVLRRKCNIMVLNLALTDLLVGSVVLPYEITSYTVPQMATIRHWCILRYMFFTLLLMTSIMTLLAISVERYIAIVHSMHSRQLITGRRIVCVIVMMWIINIAFSVSPIFGWNKWQTGVVCLIHNVLTRNYRLIMYAVILSCLVLNLTLYFKVALTIMRRVSLDGQSFQQNSVVAVSVSSRFTKANVKHTKVMIIILGLFIICWLPVITLATVETVIGQNIPGLLIAKMFFLATAIANSGLNWIVYGWKNAMFRKVFRELLCCGDKRLENQGRVDMHVTSSESKDSSDSCRTMATVSTDMCHF